DRQPLCRRGAAGLCDPVEVQWRSTLRRIPRRVPGEAQAQDGAEAVPSLSCGTSCGGDAGAGHLLEPDRRPCDAVLSLRRAAVRTLDPARFAPGPVLPVVWDCRRRAVPAARGAA